MSTQKFPKKRYETPMHPWKESRIKSERELIKKYGLKNHKEVWKAKTYLGKHREQARELLAKVGTANPQVKKESDQLLVHLTNMGILATGASLDDVLALETEVVLSRRLQTLVYLKGFSSTPYQARQLINHGHIAINGRKVTVPGYMIKKDDEGHIQYTVQSPLNEMSHPARPKTDAYRTEAAIPMKQQPEEKPTSDKVVPKQEPVTTAVVAATSAPTSVVPAAPTPAETTQSTAPVVEKPVEEQQPKAKEEKPKEPKKEKKETEA